MSSNLDLPNGLQNAKDSRGKSLLQKMYQGKKLTRPEAVIAKCCECSGYYIDGRLDCEMPKCPLYDFMPYRSKKKDNAQELFLLREDGVKNLSKRRLNLNNRKSPIQSINSKVLTQMNTSMRSNQDKKGG